MFPQTAAAALGLATVAAAQGFTVDQVANPNAGTISLVDLYHRGFYKYGATPPGPPSGVVAATPALQSGSVAANPATGDSEYICPVQIGTPAKTLNLDFDSGSSDLWVFSNSLPASQQTGHNLYVPGSSSTSKTETGETWSITYQDQSNSAGFVVSDKVVVGGATVTSQAVEVATSASSQFVSGPSDGLLGLAFDVINQAKPNKVLTFFTNLKASLPKPLFAATLKHAAPGSYDFGFINPARYTGAIAYTPVVHPAGYPGFWSFKCTGTSVGSGNIVKRSISAIADTGTTLLYMPSKVVSNYYASVSGSQYNTQVQGYIFPCSASLPALNLKIGSGTFAVPGAYINFTVAGTIGSQYYCYGGLQRNTGLPFSIFGDIFLKSVYAVFDVGNNQLGFAKQK